MANYSLGIKPLPKAVDDQTFTGDNFLQLLPHTKIFEGVKGLRFVNCNLTNCDIPADAETNIQIQHVEWCSHLHEHFVKWGLSECAENCEHVADTDKITVDGVVIDTVYHYSDKAVA